MHRGRFVLYVVLALLVGSGMAVCTYLVVHGERSVTRIVSQLHCDQDPQCDHRTKANRARVAELRSEIHTQVKNLRGPRGPRGRRGRRGRTGPRGRQGRPGLRGPIGRTGRRGPRGIPGAIGPIGRSPSQQQLEQAAHDALCQAQPTVCAVPPVSLPGLSASWFI